MSIKSIILYFKLPCFFNFRGNKQIIIVLTFSWGRQTTSNSTASLEPCLNLPQALSLTLFSALLSHYKNFHTHSKANSSFPFILLFLPFIYCMKNYSWPLNNTGLHCMCPLVHRFFFNSKFYRIKQSEL